MTPAFPLLAGVVPEHLGVLNLSFNRLRVLPSALGGAPVLQQMYLANNQLADLPDSFAKVGADPAVFTERDRERDADSMYISIISILSHRFNSSIVLGVLSLPYFHTCSFHVWTISCARTPHLMHHNAIHTVISILTCAFLSHFPVFLKIVN